MDKLTIRKTGLYFSFWDESSEDWIERSITDSSIPLTWYLNYPIQFDGQLTVRELLTVLKPYSEIIDLVMIRELAGTTLESIYKLLNDGSPTGAEVLPSHVYLIKLADAIPTKQEEEFIFLNSYPVLLGVTEIDEMPEDDELYSLSSINFLDWCDLPIGVDDFLEYIDSETEDTLLEGMINWTLAEALSAILNQISVTVQISQTSIVKSNPDSGPLQIADVFEWLDDLDRIFCK
jgi:hypothetical protein